MIDSLQDYESILNSEDLTIRRKAATDTATNEVWLEILTKRPDLEEEVAFNKHLPVSILEILVNSSSSRVRAAVAMKRNLDHQMFQKLASDPDDSVRMMVAHNRKSPIEVLMQLANDSCEGVSEAAKLQLQGRHSV